MEGGAGEGGAGAGGHRARRIPLALAVSLVLGLVAGAGAVFPAWKVSPPPPPLVSDLKPGKGKGAPPADAKGSGPWASRIILATAKDGLSFVSTGELLTDQAGVADLVVGPDGRLRSYYVDWANGNVVRAAIQKAARAWVYKRVTIMGALPKPPASDPVDPTVVVLTHSATASTTCRAVTQVA